MNSTILNRTTKFTCLFATLFFAVAVYSQTTTNVSGLLKREVWLGWTREQVTTNIDAVTGVNIISPDNTTYPNSWDVPDDNVDDYAARYSGFVIPDTTQAYDFFLACDDDTDLYLSTDSSPTNKYLIAQETAWSEARNWNTPGEFNMPFSIASQKRSDQWTNQFGITPFINGITLNSGVRYYLEAIYRGDAANNTMSVTMVPHGLGPLDGDATTLTNGLIGVSIPTPSLLLFTTQPTNKTMYPGMTAYFRAATTDTSVVPPSFEWLRIVPGVSTNVIPNANNSSEISSSVSSSIYSLVVSTNDNGVQFRCVAKVPATGTPVRMATSSPATLTVPTSGGLTVANHLKRELFTGLTAVGAVSTITNGSQNYASPINAFSSFEVPSAGVNYGERVNGFFTPTSSGNYVFFLSANANAVLFVSTNNQPAGKLLVAQEDGFSTQQRDWLGSSAQGGSIPTQRRSDFWSPDGGFTLPYATGIPLTAGQRYYIEAVHRGAVGNNHIEVTYYTTDEVAMGMPFGPDPSRLTNGVISYVTTPVTTFAIVSQPPAMINRTEGEDFVLAVGVATDSEITPAYQWRVDGQPINGATGPSYGATALAADNNKVFRCDISIPGVTNVSSSNTLLTVTPGDFASGFVKREIWTNNVTTRTAVGANLGVPDPHITTFVPGFNITTDFGDNYVDRLTGYFVPPVTTNYVFFLACDNDADLFISTNEQASGKFMIAQETVQSPPYNWTGATPSNNAQRRSDQFNGGVYASGIPLVAGQLCYIEIVHHDPQYEDSITATYIYSGEPDPPNGSPAKLVGDVIGVPVPITTVMNITTQPLDVTTYAWEPVYFNVFATNNNPKVPATYQWRRGTGPGDMTNLPGVVGSTFGFITSTNDDGAKFDCVVMTAGAPSLTQTSAIATLTLVSGPTYTPGSLKRERWDGPFNRPSVETGASGPAQINDTIPTPLVGGSADDNFVQRFRGFFLPPATSNYVFFVAADNDTDVFLGTDDQPNSKVLICQEQAWSANNLSWLAALGGGISSFKRSDQFAINDAGTGTPEYTNGIPLIAGQRYYFETVWHEGGGGDFLGITFTYFGDPDPVDGLTPSVLTSNMFAHMEAPVVVIPPVLSVVPAGGMATISWTPSGGTLLSTPSLSPPVIWSTVGTINPTNVPIGPGNMFFRVSVP